MPDNGAEIPATPTDDRSAADRASTAANTAGDASRDRSTDGSREATTRPHRQRPYRSGRTRALRGLARRRSARRAQGSGTTVPVRPRLNRRRQHSEASAGESGPRRRTRGQRHVNGASPKQRPTRRAPQAARKPAARGGPLIGGNGSVSRNGRRSRRAAEADRQPASHSGGRKTSRLTRSASYRALGREDPTVEPVASSLGRPLQSPAQRWSSLGQPTTSNTTAGGATYRALGQSSASTEHAAQTDGFGAPVYRSLGRSSLPLHRTQSPVRQSNAKVLGKTVRAGSGPTRRSRLRRASQRPRPGRPNPPLRDDS